MNPIGSLKKIMIFAIFRIVGFSQFSDFRNFSDFREFMIFVQYPFKGHIGQGGAYEHRNSQEQGWNRVRQQGGESRAGLRVQPTLEGNTGNPYKAHKGLIRPLRAL